MQIFGSVQNGLDRSASVTSMLCLETWEALPRYQWNGIFVVAYDPTSLPAYQAVADYTHALRSRSISRPDNPFIIPYKGQELV
jgi:hypothetical protein